MAYTVKSARDRRSHQTFGVACLSLSVCVCVMWIIWLFSLSLCTLVELCECEWERDAAHNRMESFVAMQNRIEWSFGEYRGKWFTEWQSVSSPVRLSDSHQASLHNSLPILLKITCFINYCLCANCPPLQPVFSLPHLVQVQLPIKQTSSHVSAHQAVRSS